MTIAPFDPDRFDKAVAHYVAARLRYAPALITWLAKEAGVAGKRVLDLGCGPGFIANAIAPLAESVLGLDPSPNMVDAARQEAASNARFELGSSLDLTAVKAPVQLVTIGRAFHWMDRAQTLRDLDPLVAQDGAIALIFDRVSETPMNAWWHAANAVAKQFAVRDTFQALKASPDWVRHEEILASSAFSDLRVISVFQRHRWTYEDVLRNTLSRSANTEEKLGDTRAAMEAALAKALAPFGPGPWASLNEHTALVARRPQRP